MHQPHIEWMKHMKTFTKVLLGGAALLLVGVIAVENSWPGITALVLSNVGTSRKASQTYTIQDEAVPLAGPGLSGGASIQNTVTGDLNQNGWLQVKGSRLLNENGQPVQLRGLSSHGIAWYPQYAKYDAIKTTKEYGANVFRIAMYVDDVPGKIGRAHV